MDVKTVSVGTSLDSDGIQMAAVPIMLVTIIVYVLYMYCIMYYCIMYYCIMYYCVASGQLVHVCRSDCVNPMG